ncbi:SIS domain-containing protein [Ensifer soli]|uniref:SIS domain-containing protein n=1 Tax=Ciceribacter sp. sgz301302 TaxID=3342379 RepID=UPI0035B78CE6
MRRDFNVDRQIAAIPEVVDGLLGMEVPALDPARPILFTGIGTSLHAARVAAGWIAMLTGGRVRPQALDAHDVGTFVPLRAEDQVVVISHRGYKIFPTAALVRAREAGARTLAIVGTAAPEQAADEVLRTCANETAGTFTVSYLGSLTVLALLAAAFDGSPDRAFARALRALPQALAKTLRRGNPAAAAQALSDAEVLLVVGFGLDLSTAAEAALKIKEGAWLWTEAMSPEFALHGTPASYRPGMAAAIIEPAEDDGGRTALLFSVLDRLGLKTLAVGERDGLDLSFVSPHPLLRPLTGIVPLQRLTAELARLRGTNPDTMHGDREPWRSVMTGIRL